MMDRLQTTSGPVVVELTSKRWKRVQLIGGALIIVGLLGSIIGVAAHSPVALYLSAAIDVAGILVIGYGSIMAWWHHG